MEDFFEMVDYRNQTKNALYHHAFIMFTTLTELQVGHFFAAFAEAVISQNVSLLIPQSGDVSKVLIVSISGLPTPINNLALWCDQPAQFDPNDPTVITQAFFTDLSLTPSFSDGMNKLDAKTIIEKKLSVCGSAKK
jgi:hypothetical protein